MSRAEVRVDLLPVHLPSAVRVPAPLHLTRALVWHALVGRDSLVEEQTPLALDDRAPEVHRLARCAGLLVLHGGCRVEMQRIRRLGDGVTPAVVDDVSLVIVKLGCASGSGDLMVVVVRTVLLIVGCDVVVAVDWAIVVMEVVHKRCLRVCDRELLHRRPLEHCRYLLR